jgi:hypothetical protein
MQRIALGSLAATLVALVGCTAETGGPSKAEYAADVSTGARGGKADEADFCEENGWYGDGICDWFCPLTDQDCTDDACTVGADSTCGEGETCQPGYCYFYCPPGGDCCAPAHCEAAADFCTSALCGPGTYCDEEADACVPVEDDFCPRALCAPGTVCDEEEDRCVPVDDDCPPVLCELYCPYGFETGEDGCAICSCADEPPAPTCPPTGVLCTDECEDGRTPGGAPCNRGAWNDETCSCDPLPAECPPTGVLCTDECEDGRTPGGAPCNRGAWNDATCSCDPLPPAACVRGGCSSQLCVPAGGPPVYTTCEWRPEYACIQQQVCEPQADGSCGFTDTPESDACFADL